VVVVDASALAAIAFGDDQADDVVGRLEGEDLHAPALFGLEMAHATLSRCRRSPARSNEFVAGFHRVLDLPIVLHEVPPLAAFALASNAGLSAYDASYLWLSRSLRAPLVTVDRRLLAVVRGDR